jgi:hypothetical protein
MSLFQVWPPTAPKPIRLDLIGVPLDLAVALTGLSRSAILCAGACGVVPLYQDDKHVIILEYADLPKVLHWLPRWQPTKRHAREATRLTGESQDHQTPADPAA